MNTSISITTETSIVESITETIIEPIISKC